MGRIVSFRSVEKLPQEPRGTFVGFTATTGGRRRTLEIDGRGTLVTLARWTPDGALAEAAVRVPDSSWLVIVPCGTDAAPWGMSDRVWRADRPCLDARARPLTVFASLDYGRIATIPPLAEPARLPAGGGTAVLNFIANLAKDQGRPWLVYAGPYPTEQLFLALLESFRYDVEVADPLAAFSAGTLRWRPAPHERLFTAAGAYVQLRGRIEKVVWRGRRYCRPDWQAVARHSPYRVRDVAGGAGCSLWALGRSIEDHLRLTPAGDVVVLEQPRAIATTTEVAPAIRDGVIEAIVAASAAPLADFIRQCGQRLTLDWRPIEADLVDVRDNTVSFSSALRDLAQDMIAGGADRRARVASALTTLTEMAALLGDALRARAQVAIAALPEPRQREILAAGEGRGSDAARISTAVEALLDDFSAGGLDDQPDVEGDEERDGRG